MGESHVHQNNISHSLSHSSVFRSLQRYARRNLDRDLFSRCQLLYNPTDDHTSYYEAKSWYASCTQLPVVGKMQEDAEHNLWICTGGRTEFLRPANPAIHPIRPQQRRLVGIGHNNLKCIWLRKETGAIVYRYAYRGTHNLWHSKENGTYTQNSPDKAALFTQQCDKWLTTL